MDRCGLLRHAGRLAQALLDIFDDGTHTLVFLSEIRRIEVQMRDDSDAVSDVIENQDCFGKADDGQWQIEGIALRNWNALKTRY